MHERIVSRCDFNGQVQKIVDSMSKEINAVKVNYNKVYVVAKNMGSAKEIAKYLKELGFDISSLENDNITALVADIDRTKSVSYTHLYYLLNSHIKTVCNT